MPRPGDRYTSQFSYGYPLVSYYSPVGDYETNEYLQIPHGLPAGGYELRRQNLIVCTGLASWVEFAPAATLTIINDPAK